MHKAFDKLVAGIKRYSLSIGVLGLAFIIVGTHFATAQQSGGNNNSNSLGNHHTELTVNVDPGGFAYVPLPKQNTPINVQLVAQGPNSEIVEFTVSDLTSAPLTSQVNFPGEFIMYPTIGSDCSDKGDFGAKYAFLTVGFGTVNNQPNCITDYDTVTGGVGDKLVFGIMEPQNGVPNRIFVSYPDAVDNNGNPIGTTEAIKVHINLWY
ncbi:MAG: hypothetical protein AAB519_03495 [Patescibacteria group bacterium]